MAPRADVYVSGMGEPALRYRPWCGYRLTTVPLALPSRAVVVNAYVEVSPLFAGLYA
jgi:hypothetical protein